MRLATVKQSQEIDELSQKVYGLTGEILMESAGCMAAREIDQSYMPELQRGAVGVVCGPGNNGGDGLVVARHLHAMGHRDLTVYLLSPKDAQAPLFKLQLHRAELHGLRLIDVLAQPDKLEQLKSSHLIIDAMFGIGLNRRLEGEFVKAVDLINSCKCPVVSLDCPSGLQCDTGVVEGAVVTAHMTLTFGLAKPGFFVSGGPAQVGKLRILPIGFSYESRRGVATTHFLFNERLARRYLPVRKETANKSDFGHVLVLAGRPGFWGAGVLAATSALRTGCGYVTWASQPAPHEVLQQIPDVLTQSLDSSALWDQFKYDAVVIGPGLGVSQQTAQLISQLRQHENLHVVVDADALTTCVQHELFPLPANWVLTPHAGELSRILKVAVADIERDRFTAALSAAKLTGAHVLLKGYRSVLAVQERCMVIDSGNSSLAKAGTGDVLSGMIASLLAQGMETLQGTATAAYIHGRIADEWVRAGHDKRTLIASDVRDHLPQLLSRITRGGLV